MKPYDINPDIEGASEILREEGYCVVILTPGVLNGVDPHDMEAILNERALQALRILRENKE